MNVGARVNACRSWSEVCGELKRRHGWRLSQARAVQIHDDGLRKIAAALARQDLEHRAQKLRG